MQDYFTCDNCRNKDFTRIYNFAMRFYTVNFSDELVYDRMTEEVYRCTKCNKTFPKEHIDNFLAEIKKKRKTKG